jgi:type VI protein secretion system component VasK
MLGDGMRRIVWAAALVVVALLLGVAVWAAIARPAFGRTVWMFVQDYRWWLALALVVVVAVFLLRWLLGAFLGNQRCSPWRARVRASADALKHQLDALPPRRTRAQRQLRDAVGQAVHGHLRPAVQ